MRKGMVIKMTGKKFIAAISSLTMLLSCTLPVYAEDDVKKENFTSERPESTVETSDETFVNEDVPASEQLVYEVIPDEIEQKAKNDEDFAEAILQDPIYRERLQEYEQQEEYEPDGSLDYTVIEEDGTVSTFTKVKTYEAAAKASTSGSWNPNYTLYHQSRFDDCTYEYVLDVSYWQNNIDWNKVYNAGVRNVFIRAGYSGYSNGVNYLDGMFYTYIKGAKAAGLKVGVYYYSASVNASEAETEAKSVVQWVKNSGIALDFPIWYDFECTEGRCANLTNVTNNMNMVGAFCNYVWDHGYNAGLYSYYSYITSRCNISTINKYYPLWFAHYTNYTGYSGKFQIWQFSSSQRVNGVSGNVDMSVWYKEASIPNNRVINVDKVEDVPKDSVQIKTDTKDPFHATISWGTATNAQFYRVYTKDEDWVYHRISDYIYSKSCTISLREGKNGFTIRAGRIVNGKEILSENYYNYEINVVTGDIDVENVPLSKISTAKSSSGKVKISWDSVKNAQYYRVYKRQPDGKWKRIVDEVYGNSFVADLTDGVNEFTIRAGAKNSYGKEYLSPDYYSFNVYEGNIDLDNVPLEGMDVAFPNSSSSDKNIIFSWKSVPYATAYRVYDKSTGEWARLSDSTSDTSYKLKLNNGVNHLTVRALAYNNDGKEMISPDYYDYVIGVDDVKNLTCSKNGTGYILRWDPVEGANNYIITNKKTGVGYSLSSNRTSYSVSSADIGTVFTVQARQTVKGHYLTSLHPTSITIEKEKVLPAVNNTLKFTNSTLNSISLSWTKSADTSDYKVTGYILNAYSAGELVKSVNVGASTTSYTFAGLDKNTSHSFTITVMSDAGNSTVSPKIYGVTKISNVVISSSSSTENSVTIDFSKPGKIEGYTVYLYNESTKKWNKVSDLDQNAVTYTIKGLADNTTYKVGIEAYRIVDGNKTTSASMTIRSIKTPEKPKVLPPVNKTLKFTKSTLNSISLSWNKTLNTTNYKVTGYILKAYSAGELVKSVNVGALTTSYTFTGLNKNTSHSFTITVVADTGNSAVSPKIYGVTKISNVKINSTEVTDATAKISFSKPGKLQGYTVYLYNDSTKKWDKVNDIDGDAVSCTVSGLKGNTTYRIGIEAYRTVDGNKTTSKSITSYTVTTLLSQTVITDSKSYENSVSLTWANVPGAQGYVVYKYNDSKKTWERYRKTTNTNNSITVTGLTSGTAYRFTVRAYKTVNGNEQLGYSYKNYYTCTNPAKVSWSVSFPTKGAVRYTWNKVNGASGYILYYRLKGAKDWTRVKISGDKTVYSATAANTMSFTTTGFKPLTEYQFTVKAIKAYNGEIFNGRYTAITKKTK